MRYPFLKYAAVATVAIGIVFAQAPTGNLRSGASTEQGWRGFMRWDLEHIAQALNLTDSQKEQARTMFEQARQSAEPVLQELKQNHEALTAAAKAGKSEIDIQNLANERGRLLGKLVAIRTVASAKFYQMLTPEQRVKADQMHEQFRQRVRSGERKNGL
jgi:Spy/CpxP family protein refolding chaperone